MSTYRLIVVFTGVDFDDYEVFEALAELPDMYWRSDGTHAFATAIVNASSVLEAARNTVRAVTDLVPTARAVRLDDDLVSIQDVASRIGVTREAVRNWANGTRRDNFPSAKGVVGDGIKVWAWSDVNAWLRSNLNLGDVETLPAAKDIVQVNEMFAGISQNSPSWSTQ